MEYTDYDTRLAAYAVIVDAQDRLLLALWNETDRQLWTLPGGGVEFEETPEQGAVREVREETGYDVELVRLLGIDIRTIPTEQRITGHRPMKAVRVYYEARVVGGELTAEIDGTTDEARWWPLAEVPGLDHVSAVDAALGYLASPS